jgi:hypothetical protein
MDENERRRIMRESGALVHPLTSAKSRTFTMADPSRAGELRPFLRDTNDQPTRAAQMAANIERKLSDLGQLPDAKPEKLVPEKETAEQVARRAVLKAKLKSFVG